MYRVMAATLLSGLICMFLTPLLIRLLNRKSVGQIVRTDGPEAHISKEGTPSMGGLVIILGTCISYLLFSGRTPEGLAVLFTMTGCGALGFADDYIKIRKKRSLGLTPKIKIIGQAVVAVIFTLIATNFSWVNADGVPSPTLPDKLSMFGDTFGPSLGVFFLLWVFFMLAAESNAVNLTDGLDGLASGSMIVVVVAYLLISFTMFRHPSSIHPSFYQFSGQPALDISIICGALLGACLGFLWWNAAPARIFMGDTGSLALGGAVAAIAIMTRTQLLVPLLGGLFTLEALSVVIQVAVFKVTGGKRVFRMAPIHHHFELGGWAEFTVMVRLWIVAGISVFIAFGLFYLNFVSRVPL